MVTVPPTTTVEGLTWMATADAGVAAMSTTHAAAASVKELLHGRPRFPSRRLIVAVGTS